MSLPEDLNEYLSMMLGEETTELLEEELPPKSWIRVPEVEYEIPVLPVEELKEPERLIMIGWLGAMLDAEGSLYDAPFRYDKVAKIDRWLYKYEYIRPVVAFSNANYKIVVQWCSLVDTRPPEKKPEPFVYYPRVMGARAMAYILLTRPYLIKFKDRAEEYLKKYKRRVFMRT